MFWKYFIETKNGNYYQITSDCCVFALCLLIRKILLWKCQVQIIVTRQLFNLYFCQQFRRKFIKIRCQYIAINGNNSKYTFVCFIVGIRKSQDHWNCVTSFSPTYLHIPPFALAPDVCITFKNHQVYLFYCKVKLFG